MSKAITSTQTFFSEKIFPYLNEVYNYSLLINNDDHIAEKQLLKSCKDVAWFSEYLSLETDTRIWLLRIMMKIVEDQNQENSISTDTSSIEQVTDLSKLDKDILKKENQYETSKKIRNVIVKLPYNLKQALILTDLLKFDYNQAADLIDIPEGALVTRLYDARKLLLLNLISGSSTFSSDDKTRIYHKDKKIIISLSDEQKGTDISTYDKTKFKNEIEIQQYVKGLFEKYISPQPIRQVIKEKIVKKLAPQLKKEINRGNSSGRKSFITVATIVMLVLAVVLILLNRPKIINPLKLAGEQRGTNNILIRLEKNYDSFINHHFDSLMIKVDPETINNNLENASPGNEPIFLILSGWNPVNYFITKFKDQNLINIVYKNESGAVLITVQIPLKSIGEEKTFNLTNNLFDYLKSENCFVSRRREIALLLKIIGRNVLGVVGQNLDKDVLVAICNQKTM
ncbi:hypothetical protein LJE86_15320 [bacterium BMS3Abin03]|nr:hypothetical protein [bacterium BMS3Abin03]